MSANVETMMYVREKPWHGLGTMVENAPNSAEALRLAGLDWTVNQKNLYTENGIVIPNYKANTRSSDGKVLGVVSDRYKIVQNTEAFSFTDAIIGETENGVVTYETAGSLNGGRRVWMLAKMPTQKILDDDIEPYMCFTNSHDGKGAVQICMTPVRVVCNNTLNMALSGAKRSWSTKHVGDLEAKMEEAKICLGLANKYMENLDEYATKMSEAIIYKEQLDEVLSELFPISPNDSARKQENVNSLKSDFYMCYLRPDIAQYFNTAWGAMNAMSDMITHGEPKRNTATFNENRWGKIMDGHAVMDKFNELLCAKVGVKA